MDLTQERADAIRLALTALTSDLEMAGHLVVGHGLSLDDTTLKTSGEELSLAAQTFIEAWTLPEAEAPPIDILLLLLEDVTDVDETKPIIAAMLMLMGAA